jgi:hypothetical protein
MAADRPVSADHEQASARPWWFDGRDVFHKKPGTNLDQIIIPLGQVLSDTFTADGAVNPADVRLFVDAVNERDALVAALAAAEKERDEARANADGMARAPYGEFEAMRVARDEWRGRAVAAETALRERDELIRDYTIAISRAPGNRDEDEITALSERLVAIAMAAPRAAVPAETDGETT